MTERGLLLAAPEATIVFPAVPEAGGAGSAFPLGAPRARRPLDPSDLRPYAFDFTALLADAVEIAAIEAITMSAAGAAVGVLVEAATPRRPIIDAGGGKKVQLWLSVAGGSVSNPAFDGAGIDVGIAVLIRTTAAIEERIERTGVINVRQL